MKEYLEIYLKQKGINTRNNFKCLVHDDKKPSMSYKNNRIRCFSGKCGVSMDIYDLIQYEYSCDFIKAKQIISEMFGIDQGYKMTRSDMRHIDKITEFQERFVHNITESVQALCYLHKNNKTLEKMLMQLCEGGINQKFHYASMCQHRIVKNIHKLLK